MIKLYDEGVYLLNGNTLVPESQAAPELMRKKKMLIKELFLTVSYRLITSVEMKNS
mgnify:CR=1 FL=1